MANDKTQIGVLAEMASTLTSLVADGHFPTENDAAKFAVAFAIQKRLPVGTTQGVTNKWSVVTLDSDGRLAAVVRSFYPSVSEPYRLIEHFINEGLKLLSSNGHTKIDIHNILFSGEA